MKRHLQQIMFFKYVQCAVQPNMIVSW